MWFDTKIFVRYIAINKCIYGANGNSEECVLCTQIKEMLEKLSLRVKLCSNYFGRRMTYNNVEKLPHGSVWVQTVDSDVICYCFNSNKLFKKKNFLWALCVSIRWDAEFCKSFSTDLHTSVTNYHLVRLSSALIPLFISYLFFLFRFLPS